jgi:hypothetical protein
VALFGRSICSFELPNPPLRLPMGIRSKFPYTRHLKTGARASVRECNEHRYDRTDEKTAREHYIVRDGMPRSGLLFRIGLRLGWRPSVFLICEAS